MTGAGKDSALKGFVNHTQVSRQKSYDIDDEEEVYAGTQQIVPVKEHKVLGNT